jgi:hypothetical protein
MSRIKIHSISKYSAKNKFSKFHWRTGPKSFRGNKFYKNHRVIAEKASHHFKKASIPLKMVLKSLTVLEKA